MEKLFSSKWLNVFNNNGWLFASRKEKPAQYWSRRFPDAVTIVATTENGYMVVIRQWRHTISDFVYEFPAGLIDNGETAKQAAVREFKEETGLDLEVERVIPGVFSSIGLTDECHTIVSGVCTSDKSERLRKTLGPQVSGDTSDENIRVEYWDMYSVEELIKHNNVDAKLAMLSLIL